jgi:hypothetical protein
MIEWLAGFVAGFGVAWGICTLVVLYFSDKRIARLKAIIKLLEYDDCES